MASILVVDDREVDRRYLRSLFEALGHVVLEAADGADALEIIARSTPDLVISDLLMPRVDGFDLVRRLREQPATAAIPVMFYSATYRQSEARALAAMTGVIDVLAKPVEPEVLVAHVSNALRQAATVVPSPPPSFDRLHAEVLGDKLGRTMAELDSIRLDLIERRRALEVKTRLAAFQAEISRILAAHGDLETALQHCAEGIVRHMDAAFARIWILNAQQLLELKASAGMYTTLNGSHARIRVGDHKIGLIARERQAHVTNSVVGDPRVHDQEWAIREGMVSFAGHPLVVGDELVGVVAMFARHALAEDVLDTLGSAASEIAVGVARLTTEQKLRKANERTSYALDAARIGVWELDLQTDQLTWLPEMSKVFGLGLESFPRTGADFLALVRDSDRPAFGEAIETAVRDVREFEVQFRTDPPGGRPRWIHGRGKVQRENGIARRVHGVAIDATERASLEAQLRQAQKLEAVGQLAAGIAHDFNNILTTVLGYSRLVEESMDPDDRRRDEMGEVTKAAERAMQLTRKLQTFSRKEVLEPQILDLNRLIADMTPMLRRLIGEDIELVTSLPSPALVIRADAGHLDQVVMNLVVNARDAMPEGGRLSIETARVDLDGSHEMRHGPVQRGPHALLTVVDAGIGMDEETQAHIFEPFFTTKPAGKGTGLGLATAYGIVQQSGGHIWVYSEPGQGTVFKVYLPLVGDSAAVPVAVSEAPIGGTESVLVVEDDDALRPLTCRLLRRAGYRVTEAVDADQAEAFVRRTPHGFDLLVTDVVMPKVSGPALHIRLAAIVPNLRVLFVSGYASDALAPHQLGTTMHFLQKPFSMNALHRKVREALDS